MPASVRAKRIWKRLAQNYGTRLAEQYGAGCPEDWCQVIDRLDDGRIEQALMKVRHEYIHAPPTLGEFDAAIPRRTFSRAPESMPDQLAQQAVVPFNLCTHQLMRPWNYFGETVDDGNPTPFAVTKGVVIPACSDCQQPSYRLMASELGR